MRVTSNRSGSTETGSIGGYEDAWLRLRPITVMPVLMEQVPDVNQVSKGRHARLMRPTK